MPNCRATASTIAKAAGHGAGVRRDGELALLALAGLQQYDGLAPAVAVECEQGFEPLTVADVFKVHAHGVGLFVGEVIFQNVALVYIQLVPDGGDVRHAEGLTMSGSVEKPFDEPGYEEPGLAHDRDIALAGLEELVVKFYGRAVPQVRHVKADGVRPHDANVPAAYQLMHLAGECLRLLSLRWRGSLIR